MTSAVVGDATEGLEGAVVFTSAAVFSAFVPGEAASALVCDGARWSGFGLSFRGASFFATVFAALDVSPTDVEALLAAVVVDALLADTFAASVFIAGLAFFAGVLRAVFGLVAAVEAREVGFSAGFSPPVLGVFAFATLGTFPILVTCQAVLYNLRQHLGWSSR
ncbi:hypothetical protein [Sulfitobacter marinus]|uniref:hypothetical protein n=1 Tax=Sulfitobacter marinus TaxID=394264 RepID=UPI0011139BB2|nr:hypothetical protein [Sulfitobacter marinus]